MNSLKHQSSIVFSPLFLVCLVLLLINDHFLKQAFPGLITGKLSDFTGLFVVGSLIISFSFKREGFFLVLVGFLFLFWKSAYSQPLIDAWNQLEVWNLNRTVDYWDLLALPMLYAARVYARRCAHIVPRNVLLIPILGLSFIAVMATSYVTECSNHFNEYRAVFVNQTAADAVLSVKRFYSSGDPIGIELTAEPDHDIFLERSNASVANGGEDECRNRIDYARLKFSQADGQAYTICEVDNRNGEIPDKQRWSYDLKLAGEVCSDGSVLAEIYE